MLGSVFCRSQFLSDMVRKFIIVEDVGEFSGGSNRGLYNSREFLTLAGCGFF